jgi:DAK2 domain fusion protein YloV
MNTLSGQVFAAMVLNGYRDLKSQYEKINDLNVFPVPDGDTGTNIAATLTGGVKAMATADQNNIGDVSEKLAEGMLLGARGNSGVILSQFFAGIANALADLQKANVTQFAAALRSGTQKAYEAVVQPVEGTILTVAREGSAYVMDHLTSIPDFESLFEVLLSRMREALERTPDLLPVLKEAGVIDSGGAGLVCIIEGMGKEIMGEEVADSVFNGPQNSVSADAKVPFDENSVLTYGYCTEFILQLQKSKGDPKAFQIKDMIAFLSTIGDSIVAIKQGTIVKIHVHTKVPYKAIEYAQRYGEFVTFKMENMSIQHNEVLLKEMPIEGAKMVKAVEKPKDRVNLAIVAVSPSDPISNLFKEMGVSEIISGGQTMNPSAQDFVEAFKNANADNIIVFPNNGNVILTAQQAAKLFTGSKITIMESKSLVEAYSALSMADPVNETVEENIVSMKNSMENLTAAEVCPAIRDSINNGIQIKKGDFIAIKEGTVVAAKAKIIDSVAALLQSIDDIDDKEVLTVFYGVDATEKNKDDLKAYVSKTYPMMEVVEIDGQQTIYPFVFAVE